MIVQQSLHEIAAILWNQGNPCVVSYDLDGKPHYRGILLPEVSHLVLRVKKIKSLNRNSISVPFAFRRHQPYVVESSDPNEASYKLSIPSSFREKFINGEKGLEYSADFMNTLIYDADVCFKTDFEQESYFVKQLCLMCPEKQFHILRQYKPIFVRFKDPLAKYKFSMIEEKLPAAPNLNRSLEWANELAHNDKYESTPYEGITYLKDPVFEHNDLQNLVAFGKKYNFRSLREMRHEFQVLNQLLWSYQYFRTIGFLSQWKVMWKNLDLCTKGYVLKRASYTGDNYEKPKRFPTTSAFLKYYSLFHRVFTGKKFNKIIRILRYPKDGPVSLIKPVCDIVVEAQGKKQPFVNTPNGTSLGEVEDEVKPSMFASLVDRFRLAKKKIVTKAAEVAGDSGVNDFISEIISNYIAEIPKQIYNGLKGLADSAFKGIKSLISLITETISWFMDRMAEVFEGVFEIPESLMDGKKILFCIAIVLFVVSVGYLFDSPVMKSVLFAGTVAAIAIVGGVVTDQAIGFWEVVFPREGTHTAQIGMSIMAPIFSFVASCLTSRGLATSLVILRGMPDVLSNVAEWFRWALDRLYLLLSGEKFFLSSEEKDALTDYTDQLIELYSDYDIRKKMLIDQAIGDKIKKLAHQAPAMRTALATLKGLNNKYHDYMATLMTNVMADAERVNSEALCSVSRVTPVVLWLQGKGGGGKGGSMNFFPKAVYEYVQKELPEVYPEPWNPGMKYTKSKGSVYWEQYKQQFCVVNDEFMPTSNVQERGLEGAEFLNVIDQNPLSLNMAFAGKGLNYFTSPFVIYSTNVKDDDLNTESGMTAPTSLLRRRHCLFTVSRKNDIPQNQLLQRRNEAWNFSRYHDKNMPDIQRLAMDGQETEIGPGAFIPASEALSRTGVSTMTFDQVAELVGQQIVLRYHETMQMRSQLQDYEFFPNKKSKRVNFEIQKTPEIVDVSPMEPRPRNFGGTIGEWFKKWSSDRAAKISIVQEIDTARAAIESLPVEECSEESVVIVEDHQDYSLLSETFGSEYVSSLIAAGKEKVKEFSELSPIISTAQAKVKLDRSLCKYCGMKRRQRFRKNGNAKGYYECLCIRSKAQPVVRAPMPVIHNYVYIQAANQVQVVNAGRVSEPPVPLEHEAQIKWQVAENPGHTYYSLTDSISMPVNDPSQFVVNDKTGKVLITKDFGYDYARRSIQAARIMDKVRLEGLVEPLVDQETPSWFSRKWAWNTVKWFWNMPLYSDAVFTVSNLDRDSERQAVLMYGTSHDIDKCLTRVHPPFMGMEGIDETQPDVECAKWIRNVFNGAFSVQYKMRKRAYKCLMDMLIMSKCMRSWFHNDEEKNRAIKHFAEQYGEFSHVVFEVFTHLRCLQQAFEWHPLLHQWQYLFLNLSGAPHYDIYDSSEYGLWFKRFKEVDKFSLPHSFSDALDLEVEAKKIRKAILIVKQDNWITNIAHWCREKESLSKWFREKFFFSKWRVITYSVCGILAGCLAGAIGLGAVNLFFKGSTSTPESDFVKEVVEEFPKTPNVKAQSLSKGHLARMKKRQDVQITFATQAGGGIEDQISRGINEISNAMRQIVFVYDHGEYVAEALFSGTRAFLFRHFFLVYGLDYKMVRVANANVVEGVYSRDEIVVDVLTDRDCAYVDFKNRQEMPSLSKRLLSRADLVDLIMDGNYKVGRMHRESYKGVVTNRFFEGSKLGLPNGVSTSKVVTREGQKLSFQINDYIYCVGSQGAPGYCGRPFVAIDRITGQVFVLGFHVGQFGDNSLINVLSKEDENKIKAYGQNGVDVFRRGLYTSDFLFDDLSSKRRQVYDGRMVSLGSLAKPSFIPSETNLIPSPFQGDDLTPPIYPISTAPALLKNTEVEQEDGSLLLVQPLVNGLKKIVAPEVKPSPPGFVDFVDKHPEKAFEGVFPSVRREFRLLSIQEVLPFMDSSSSISYWGKKKGFQKREQMFCKITGWVHPELEAAIKKLFRKMDKGYSLKNAMEACLKDETRDWKRVLAGKTRIFFVGCIVHLMVTIMVMGDVISFMKEQRLTTDVAIGINPHGNEWDVLWKKLDYFSGDCYVAGDFSNYDTSISYLLAHSMFKGFRDYIQWENEQWNWYLYCCCTSSVGPFLIVASELYYTNWINGSGNWMTGVTNSCCNILINNFYIYCVAQEYNIIYSSVKELVRRAFYGDDNVMKFNPIYKGIFTMPKMAEFINSLFGMTYTTPGKESCVSDYISRDEMEFLCRKFSDQGTTHAPLSEESIHGMVLWIRKPCKGVSIEEQLSINVEQACMEYFHYGEDKFNKEKLHLWKYSKQYNIPWRAHDFKYYSHRYAEGILYC